MRQVVWLATLLTVLGWLACTLPGPKPVESHTPDPLGPWRRTATGWENYTTWTGPAVRNPPALHPLLAAALLFVGAVGGALLAEARIPRRYRESTTAISRIASAPPQSLPKKGLAKPQAIARFR